jgi:hypothetical protein
VEELREVGLGLELPGVRLVTRLSSIGVLSPDALLALPLPGVRLVVTRTVLPSTVCRLQKNQNHDF